MSRKKQSHHRSLQAILLLPFTYIKQFWKRGWAQKTVLIMCTLVLVFVSSMYGVAQWYIWSKRNQSLQYGATFIPDYARALGVDPKETMQAMIDDLGIRQFRLVSYWDIHEKQPGVYDFSELDWQFQKATDAGAKVSLAIGLRQPRWPECHMPEWAAKLPKSEWAPKLKDYMGKVIERYKDNPTLQSYQLENEFFMTVFGICPDHSRERLVDEYNYVKSLDGTRPVIISRSNNWIGIPMREPLPDTVAISVYKRVWDKTITKRYYEYPLPAWFYASLAGLSQIVTGRDMIIHELQTEAWLAEGRGFEMNDPSDVAEQNKSLDAKRLAGRFSYAEATGMKEIYLWGPEWWYWRKVKANDPSLWDTAKTQLYKAQAEN